MSSVSLLSRPGLACLAGSQLAGYVLMRTFENPPTEDLLDLRDDLIQIASERIPLVIRSALPIIGILGATLAAYYCYPLSTLPSLKNFFLNGVASGVHKFAMHFFLDKLNVLIEPLFFDTEKFKKFEDGLKTEQANYEKEKESNPLVPKSDRLLELELSSRILQWIPSLSNFILMPQYMECLNRYLPGVINIVVPRQIPSLGETVLNSCFNRNIILLDAAYYLARDLAHIAAKAAFIKIAISTEQADV